MRTPRLGHALLLTGALAGVAVGQGKTLSDAHRARLDELQPKIDAAVARGVAWLLDHQQRDGSWSFQQVPFHGGQTGLSVYALLKAGLPLEHAAIQRGLAYLRGTQPTLVYAVAAQILALAEAGLADDRPHIAERLDLLLAWQDRGSWGYPNAQGEIPHLHTAADLSISQFALLGMRAAAKAGLDVPRRRWLAALEATLDYQTRPVRVDGEERAGFTYKTYEGGATGSMTTAGIACLTLAVEQLGKLSRAQRQAADQGVELGLAWLRAHFAVDENPAAGRGNLHYYLYGLERVGGLLGIEYVGLHPWYLEGAEFLVETQHKDGYWHSRDGECDTCFAILFLQRATAPITGRRARQRPVTTAEQPELPLAVRSVGGPDGSPIDLWITRMGLPATKDAPAVEWHVEKVEYRLDGEVIATVMSDPSAPWQAEPLHTRHLPTRPGPHAFEVRAHVLQPAEPEPERTVLTNAALVVEARHVLEPWMLPAAAASTQNLLTPTHVGVVRASSQWNDSSSGDKASDGYTNTAWLCAPDDTEPSLRIDLRRAVRASTLVLDPPPSQPRQENDFDHARRLRVRINKNQPLEVDAPTARRAPLRIELGKTVAVRRLEITILGREPGRNKGVAGLAEVILLRE